MEKLHAAVARSTFSSQNAKKLSGADHFLKLRCGKIARRCSEKHISKSKCQKTEGYGPLLDVIGREMVEKWHAAVAPSTFTSQNVKNTCVLHHFWRLTNLLIN